jgi:hypothetical protein
MITFPKSISIEACEKLLKDINQGNSESDLLLPVDTAKYAFGGLASAIQSAITWGRKSSSRKLLIRESKKSVAEQINEIINRPHKFTAAMFSKSISIQRANGDELRNQVNLSAKNAIDEQARNRFGQHHGSLCWFAFVDHSSKGFDRNFYIDGSEIKPEPRHPAQIQAIIHAMVEKSLLVTGGGKPPDSDDMDHLGRIFYELFLNTHEHGTRGCSRSEWLKPGIRLIYTNGISLTNEGVQGTLQGEPVLSNYLAAQDKDKKRFIEISIIDSGLGYTGRWLADYPNPDFNENLALNEEYEIFKKCFSFRQTSSFRDNKGHGLPVVMDRLTRLKGFIRIRSGRLALYRDFISNPYESLDECEFTDWNTPETAITSLTEMPLVNGVSITLLIPLEPKK